MGRWEGGEVRWASEAERWGGSVVRWEGEVVKMEEGLQGREIVTEVGQKGGGEVGRGKEESEM